MTIVCEFRETKNTVVPKASPVLQILPYSDCVFMLTADNGRKDHIYNDLWDDCTDALYALSFAKDGSGAEQALAQMCPDTTSGLPSFVKTYSDDANLGRALHFSTRPAAGMPRWRDQVFSNIAQRDIVDLAKQFCRQAGANRHGYLAFDLSMKKLFARERENLPPNVEMLGSPRRETPSNVTPLSGVHKSGLG
ncbi:MAG: hypothetical protein KGI97_00760 [Alphaproteobacteria bacterium]|nr:hypothetical protein [Alphaproteobacteria bacterium]